jgi:hypothetical protein
MDRASSAAALLIVEAGILVWASVKWGHSVIFRQYHGNSLTLQIAGGIAIVNCVVIKALYPGQLFPTIWSTILQEAL